MHYGGVNFPEGRVCECVRKWENKGDFCSFIPSTSLSFL